MKKDKKQILLNKFIISERKHLYKDFSNSKSLIKLNSCCYLGNIKYLNEIKHFINLYIKQNLENSGFKVNQVSKNFLIKNQKKIMKLPTLSINGAIYPKDETQLIYNIIVSYIFKSLTKILPFIDSVTYPTVRFKTNKKSLNSFSTHKLHSDAWSSGSVSDAVISFPILGDIKNNSVDFYETKEVHKKFFREMTTYERTSELYGNIKKIYSMKKNFWIIFDHSILHKTNSSSTSKPRVSIDLVVKLKKNKKKINKSLRNFYPPSNFFKIGENSFIKSMENFNQLNLRKKEKIKKNVSQKIVFI